MGKMTFYKLLLPIFSCVCISTTKHPWHKKEH